MSPLRLLIFPVLSQSFETFVFNILMPLVERPAYTTRLRYCQISIQKHGII